MRFCSILLNVNVQFFGGFCASLFFRDKETFFCSLTFDGETRMFKSIIAKLNEPQSAKKNVGLTEKK